MASDLRTTFSSLNDSARKSMRAAHSNITTLSKQITSGKFADNYTDLLEKSTVESLLSIKELQSTINSKMRSNRLLSAKVNEIEKTVRTLTETVVKDSLVLCLKAKDPASGNSLDIDSLAKNQLNFIKGILNTSFNGQKLFAGSKVSVQDVISDITVTSNIVAGKVTANYYNGDNTPFTENISKTQKLTYGITADEPAFASLIAAHHYMMAGNFDTAMDQLNLAKEGLGDLVTQVGENSKVIYNYTVNDEGTLIRLSEAISNIEDVDVAELMPKLTEMEVQLRASFMITTRLGDLSLVNYLK